MTKVVGEVAIDVTADIAPLVKQMKRGESAMDGLRGATNQAARGLQAFGDKAANLGKSLSVVTAAIGAAAAAGFAMAKGTADSAREIQKLSQVSNTSTDEFQRMAAAAKTVGIEQDKLADIFKDVNDRVGDFVQTGGGPMADFFEKVAPQVGITADAFKDLSGPQALQLYVDSLHKAGLSQQDMTFYMEAMASDATALLPLLANSGAEMRRLGDSAAQAGAIMDDKAIAASKRFSEALDRLNSVFLGIRNRLSVALMPAMTNLANFLADKLPPAVDFIVQKFEGFIAFMTDLPTPILEAIGVIGAALGVGGPILVGIGLVSQAFSRLLMFGPLGLFILAASTAAAAWATWGDDFKAAVGGAVDWVSGKFQDFLDILQSVVDKAVAVKDAVANALAPSMSFDVRSGAYVPRGTESGPMDGFGMGQNLGQGLIGGLGQSITDGEAELRSYIEQVPTIAKDQLGIHSPSRVFHEIGQFLGLGMANGINESTSMVAQAAANMGQIAVNQADASVGQVLSSMGQLFQGSKKLSAGIALANSWLAFTEVLKDPSFVGRPWARIAAAASALASGLNAVRNIKSAQPGGTSAGSAGAAAAQQQQQPMQVSLNTYGAGDMIRAADFGMVLDRLNAEAGDRGYNLLWRPS